MQIPSPNPIEVMNKKEEITAKKTHNIPTERFKAIYVQLGLSDFKTREGEKLLDLVRIGIRGPSFREVENSIK